MKKEEKLIIDFLQNELEKTIELKGNTLYCYQEEFTVDQLSKVLRVPSNIIIAFLWKSGRTFTRNQFLNPQILEEFCKSRKINIIRKERPTINQVVGNYLNSISKEGEKRITRAPIVSVMGHIDHGKSTLLDTICGTKNQEKEVGGITQKISIYPVEFSGKKIVFLDTPGHNVFLKMRERGASFTDLVVLVIASDDGVMPQTIEVINHIHKYKIPVIVFINNKRKGLLENDQIEKIKAQLQDYGLTPSEWGGDTQIVTGSAINKEDTDNLLENILLFSEIYEWKANEQGTIHGTAIDSYTTNKQGVVNILLVKSGTLKNRDTVLINHNFGKVKRVVDFNNKDLLKAGPGEIVQIFGLSFEAEPGDNFLVINDESLIKKIKRIVPAKSDSLKTSQLDQFKDVDNSEKEKKSINLVLVSNSQTSLEALENVVKNNSKDVILNPIYLEVGEISDSLINICKITQASILAFNVKISQKRAKELKDSKIRYFSESIIYKIEDGIKEIMKSMQEKKRVEKVAGIAEIKKVFYFSQVGSIAGCQVISGTVNRNHLVNIFRKDEKIFSGKISSLQKDKNNMKEINKGQECGIVINNFNDFQVGDKVVSYSLVEEV